MAQVLTPSCYALAREQFRSHAVLKVIAEHREIAALEPNLAPFESLVRTVMYQQLAGAAAKSIFNNWKTLFTGTSFPTAAMISEISVEEMRAKGVSRPKAAYILDLCQKVLDGTVILEGIQELEDDEVREMITKVKGFGVWSADMFLIFTLHRRDVWPTLDLGVRNGYRKLAGREEEIKPKELESLGEVLRPYRSIASLYCWRALEPGALVEAG